MHSKRFKAFFAIAIFSTIAFFLLLFASTYAYYDWTITGQYSEDAGVKSYSHFKYATFTILTVAAGLASLVGITGSIMVGCDKDLQ